MPCLSFILPLLRALHVAYSSRLFLAERDPVASLGLALSALPRRPCIYPFRLISIHLSKILTGIALEAHANFSGCKLPHNSATYIHNTTCGAFLRCLSGFWQIWHFKQAPPVGFLNLAAKVPRLATACRQCFLLNPLYAFCLLVSSTFLCLLQVFFFLPFLLVLSLYSSLMP